MRISTIIPAFNCEPYLRRAVESLLATEYPDLEIVIVDDGSRDQTLAVAKSLHREHPQVVRVVTHPGGRNRGVSATCNLGIESSTGEWLALLHADDHVYPHRFDSARAILSEQSDVDGVYQLGELVGGDAQARPGWWNDQTTFGCTLAIPPERLIFELLRGFCWATSTLVFRRSLLTKTGPFDPRLKLAEDCHLWFRMVVSGKLVAGDLQRPVSAYRRHGASADQPSAALRLDMIRAMSSFARWLRVVQPRDPRHPAISRSIADYILNGISEARTNGQRQLAWSIALKSPGMFPQLTSDPRWYGHLARMTAGRRMTSTVKHMKRWVRWPSGASAARPPVPELPEIATQLAAGRVRLAQLLASGAAPRIAIVKQDVCEDLYCCPPDSPPREILESTQLRTGPVALLSPWGARFHLLQTVDAPECRIWMERATALQWESIEFFASYRDRIPGRDYGQSRFAVAPESIDWSHYDLVVSVDVAVPASVTRQFPRTAWAYFVREIKAPAYYQGLLAPVPGQDLFLNHGFRLSPPTSPPHVVEFPYHLQYYGCFHELFGVSLDRPRSGTFVDHHTLVGLTESELHRLEAFGPVAGPILPAALRFEAGKSVPPRRTMDPDLRERLLASKYFLITPGQRRVHGTGLVEAVAAGCLAIGSPRSMETHGFVFSSATTAESIDEALQRLAHLEAHPAQFEAELARQRLLIDWLCYVRPTLALFDTAAQIVTSRRTH